MSDVSYFSGQGKVFLATRLPGGAINGGFKFLGDCDALTINASQKHDDIEESMSGNRLVAAHIPIGSTLSLKINALQWTSNNLSLATYGSYSGVVPGGTVTNEIQKGYNDSLMPLGQPQVSAVVGKLAGVTGTLASIAVLTPGSGYTPGLLALTLAGSPGTGATGYAYVGADGTLKGAFVTAAGSGYVSPTATVTTPGSGTGATFQVNMGAASLVLDTDYTVNPATGSINVLAASKLVPPQPTQSQAGTTQTVTPVSTTWNYTYGSYTGRVDGFTSTVSEVALRFEGLNMADGGNPVIVTAYRCTLDIAKTLALIEAKHGTLEFGGMLLPDTTLGIGAGPSAGLSQWFNIVKV